MAQSTLTLTRLKLAKKITFSLALIKTPLSSSKLKEKLVLRSKLGTVKGSL